MRSSIQILLILSMVCLIHAETFKFAVLSDIHLYPFYHPNVTADNYFCSNSSLLEPNSSAISAPLGRIGCDSPIQLLEVILQRLNQTEGGEIDALFLTGDFIGHGIAIELRDPEDPSKYALLKELHMEIIRLIGVYLPNTLLIPTLGNNDCKYHYQSPFGKNEDEYFSYLYDLWFQNDKFKNIQLSNNSNINETFREGGYYRVNLSESLSVLALNTLVYNQKNNPALQADLYQVQFDWIEKQLQESDVNQKFILTYHIYPGQQYYDKSGWSQFHSNFTDQFAHLLKNYSHKIIFEIAGHDHLSDLRYNDGLYNQTSPTQESSLFLQKPIPIYNPFHSVMISAAVSPNFKQNPGFSVFSVKDQVATDLELTFIPIEKTYGKSLQEAIDQIEFREVNFTKHFGIKSLSADSMHELRLRLEKDLRFLLEYLTLKVGYDPLDTEEFAKSMKLYRDDYDLISQDYESDHYICQMSQSLYLDEIKRCVFTLSLKSKDEYSSIYYWQGII